MTRTTDVPAAEVVRFAISLPHGHTFPISSGLPPILSVSPDGEQIVFAGRRADGDRLYVRRRRDLAASPLPGTEGAIGPFFSPDGRWIGFASGGALKKLPAEGGMPQTLAPTPNFRGASWGADDTIVYAPDWQSALFAVPAAGGAPRQLTRLIDGELAHRSPCLVPGGKYALMSVHAKADEGEQSVFSVHVVDLESGRSRALVDGRNPFYLPSGHLAFGRGEALHVAPFDVDRAELTGPPVQVLEGVRSDGQDSHFAVGGDGSLAYVSSDVDTGRQLVRADRQGRLRPLSSTPGRFSHPRLSPDGERVVVQAQGAIWVYDVLRGTRLRLRARGSRPIWEPGGRSILLHQNGQLYSAPIDDSRDATLLLTPERGFLFPLAWSRDGRVLAYSNAVAVTGRDVWTLPVGGHPTPFLTTPRDERAAMFSPDGRWVVYAAKETGREEEIFVQPYPGPGERIVVSKDGGIEPVWSPTGREIFYRSIDGRGMMAVDVRTDPMLSIGAPRLLFEGAFPLGDSYWSDYDVWPDGKEFLMVAADEAELPAIHVVVNWLSETGRLLASSN